MAFESKKDMFGNFKNLKHQDMSIQKLKIPRHVFSTTYKMPQQQLLEMLNLNLITKIALHWKKNHL